MRSYNYAQREGVEEIAWERFAALAARLTVALAARQVDMALGIARGGLFPATAVACALRCDLYPVRVSRRVGDRVHYARPVWHLGVTPDVAGKVVAVIDEIADTGETLAMVANRVREQNARRVVTATLVAHTWADPMPDITALVTDALVIFPWDKEVYTDGRWQPHPEIAEALRLQRARKTNDSAPKNHNPPHHS